MSRSRRWALALASLALLSCTSGGGSGEGPAPGALAIPNYHQWSARLAQGGEPGGEEGYAALAARGVSLVLSVDGVPPDPAAAARQGLKVVHVPIGYDGISDAQALQILRAFADSPQGVVYVHCHQGRHRGPAAAALLRIAYGGVTPGEAVAGLRESGCSPRYQGLYTAVQGFEPPGPQSVAAIAAPAKAVPPQGTRAAMVELNAFWGKLETARKAGWPESASPQADPAHLATLVWEGLREMRRVAARGPAFDALGADAEVSARELRDALEAKDTKAASEAAGVLADRCDTCHADFRN
ncbi:MAG: cytochrome c [Planctomycetes bacterium]|nr:cytochrome c [Planctomycetota bacterium]